MIESLHSESGIFGHSQKSLDRSYMVTSKQFDVRPLKDSIERASKGELDMSVFRGEPLTRPRTALEGSISATKNLK